MPLGPGIALENAVALQGVPVSNTLPTDTQVLKYVAATNTWTPSTDVVGTGTVTSIAQGTGMSFSVTPITTTGTINLANTAVTPGSYTYAAITVDQQGRLTAAANGVTPITVPNGGTGAATLTAHGVLLGQAASAVAATAAGTAGQHLVSGGASADPTYQTAPTQTPGGRLTLTSATPVMTTNSTAVSTVYYDTYVNNQVPVYDGTIMRYLTIGADEISLILNATDNTSGHNYDVFAFSNAGTLTIGTGPAWTSSTARGTGAGTTQLSLQNGIWTNTVSIVLRSNGSSLGTISANQATYLGTLRTTANAQTGMAFKAAAGSGGSNAFLGLWNAYNRTLVTGRSLDSTSSWTYASTTFQQANNNANNRVSYIDGLAQSNVDVAYYCLIEPSGTSSNQPTIGVLQDATTGTPEIQASAIGPSGTGTFVTVEAKSNWLPALGLHFFQAMEKAGNGGTATFFAGGNTQGIQIALEM